MFAARPSTVAVKGLVGLWVLSGLLLAGCAGPGWQKLPPGARLDSVRNRFELRTVWRLGKNLDGNSPLVVAIEGDGRPWLYRTRVARDPTPPDPLLWNWFAQWSGQALYLGRPCYYRESLPSPDPACTPYWYTNGRYSEPVINSLRGALHDLAPRRPLILLGHSGGGTLAMLLAARVPNSCAVVTLAGNLNVGAWQRAHGYSPLTGSLDPSRRPPLPGRIGQWHFYSGHDKVIPMDRLRAEARRQQARAIAVAVAGHDRGWRAFWPRLDRFLRQRVMPYCRRSTGMQRQRNHKNGLN